MSDQNTSPNPMREAVPRTQVGIHIVEHFENAFIDVKVREDLALRAALAVQRAKASMYEDWLREHVPDCPLLAENIVAGVVEEGDAE